jgi:hypothetical protein
VVKLGWEKGRLRNKKKRNEGDIIIKMIRKVKKRSEK